MLPVLGVCALNLLWPTTITVGHDGVLVASLLREEPTAEAEPGVIV